MRNSLSWGAYLNSFGDLNSLRFVKSIFAFVFVAIRHKQLPKNFGQARWIVRYKKGESYLLRDWGRDFTCDAPLTLPFETIKKIDFPSLSPYKQFNPSIMILNSQLSFTWRISTITRDPRVDSFGNSIIPFQKDGLNAIGIGTAGEINNQISQNIKVTPQLYLSSDPVLKGVEPKVEHPYPGRQVDFEDPRFISGFPNWILLNARFTGPDPLNIYPNYEMALWDISNARISFLRASNMSKSEKNWIPIPILNEQLALIKNTDPLTVVQLKDFISAASEKTLSKTSPKGFHNGSNLLQVEENLYVRIIRKRLSINGLRDIHISKLILCDDTLTELKRTKPFVLRQFAFEICNSIEMHGDKVLFAWGENDCESYLGQISKTALLEFIYNYSS